MDILRMGGRLEEEPLLLCILQNQQVFAPGAIEKPISERFRKLAADARQLKMFFLFSTLENNGDYSPPEMIKIARECSKYVFLDDIGNIKLLGSSKFTAGELKQFKKKISLGDGYVYDSRDGLEKMKVVKCERGE